MIYVFVLVMIWFYLFSMPSKLFTLISGSFRRPCFCCTKVNGSQKYVQKVVE